eukprot:sb/3476760/
MDKIAEFGKKYLPDPAVLFFAHIVSPMINLHDIIMISIYHTYRKTVPPLRSLSRFDWYCTTFSDICASYIRNLAHSVFRRRCLSLLWRLGQLGRMGLDAAVGPFDLFHEVQGVK